MYEPVSVKNDLDFLTRIRDINNSMYLSAGMLTFFFSPLTLVRAVMLLMSDNFYLTWWYYKGPTD